MLRDFKRRTAGRSRRCSGRSRRRRSALRSCTSTSSSVWRTSRASRPTTRAAPPTTLRCAWSARGHPLRGLTNRDNCTLADHEVAIAELARYRAAGGQSVVDANQPRIGRDPEGLAQIARATGLNIVMGCSYYVGPTHPRRIASRKARRTSSPNASSPSWCRRRRYRHSPRADRRGRVLVAADRDRDHGAARLGAGTARDRRAADDPSRPRQQRAVRDRRRARDAGADLSRTVMCHVDRTLADPAALRRLAETGCIVEFDLFGYEGSYYAWDLPVDMPTTLPASTCWPG